MVAADTDGDGKVSPSEREALPADIRPTADATADKYFSGGSLPVDTFVEAYNSYVSKAVALVDTNGDRNLSEAEQQNLPGAVYSSVVALRSEINSSAPTGT